MRDSISRGLTSLPLALVCLGLVLLASAERRLWETELNRADLLSLKNGESSKVVSLLADADRAPGVWLASIGPTQESEGAGPRPVVTPLSVVDHPESRAPPR